MIKPQISKSHQTGSMVLGDKLENPYSVENMRIAYLDLVKNARLSGKINIETTHLYLRYHPKNESDMDILENDSTLDWYDYPLDHEIVKQGDYYHDPTLPIDLPTYQYVVVPVSRKLNFDVEYEVLAELFLTDEDSDRQSLSLARSSKRLDLELLTQKSLELTDNVSPSLHVDKLAKKSKWKPAGKIRVWDNTNKSWFPLEGVEVRATRWFTTRKGITNSNGDFSCDGEFRRDANYSIKWERHHFSLRSGSVGQAQYNGPKQKGDWNLNINDGNSQWFYATVFKGTYHYYYKDILGLKRPPLNNVVNPQIKIACYNEDGRANHNKDRRYLGAGNQIKMYSKEESKGIINNVSSQRATETIFHELAHASHWELRKGDWSYGTTDKLQESWALAVGKYLASEYYYGNKVIFWQVVSFEDMKISGEEKYTPFIIDLIDSYNQSSVDYKLPLDRVSGYTLSQIEGELHRCSNINDLKNWLQWDHSNPTEQYVDELWIQYENLEAL